jgi:hypothetical protein
MSAKRSLYTRPELGKNELFYRGRRFWVVRVTDEGGFQHTNKGEYDLVVWDCREDYALGMVNIVAKEQYQCFSMVHVPVGEPIFDNIRQCVYWLDEILDIVAGS